MNISDKFSVGDFVEFVYYNNKGHLTPAKGTILAFKMDLFKEQQYALIKESETGRVYSIDQYTSDAMEEPYFSITRVV